MDDRAADGHDGGAAQVGERPAWQPDLRWPGDHHPGEVGVPLYVLGTGPLCDRARALADVTDANAFERTQDFLPLEGHEPGVLLLLPDAVPAPELVAVLRACARSTALWAPVLVEEDGGELLAVPLSLVPGVPLEEAVRSMRKGDGTLMLGLEDFIERVRATRHAINNPLAAAVVEVQLLLMETDDEETRRAFRNVQEQLLRIKQLVAALNVPTWRRRGGTAA